MAHVELSLSEAFAPATAGYEPESDSFSHWTATVTAATVLNQVPFVNSSWNSGVRLSQEQTQSTLNATTYMAEDQFVETLGLKLVAGRDFRRDEYQEFAALQADENAAVPSVIVSRVLAGWGANRH